MLPRKTVLLAKIEATYSVDSAPTGALNAIEIRNPKFKPLKVDKEKKETLQAYLGNTLDIAVMEEAMFEFEVLIAGAGAGGTAPKYGPLLRACGHSEVLLAADVVGTAQAGSTSTITLAVGASAVDGFYNGMVLDATGGTGSGQSSVIVDYNGTTKIATLASTEAVAYSVTTTYAIRANAQYRPISPTAFEALTFYVYRDGVLYKGLGARGTVSEEWNAKKLPVYKFRFPALFSAVTDAALVTADLSGFQTPRPSIAAYTPELFIHGFAAKTASFMLDQANDVQHQVWMNAESIDIVDRAPVGKGVVEAVLIAAKDYFTTVRNVTLGSFALRHGTAIGNSVVISAAKLQISDHDETTVNGVLAWDLGLTFQPNRGNDEYTITVM